MRFVAHAAAAAGDDMVGDAEDAVTDDDAQGAGAGAAIAAPGK
jgi:hypothetical protein